MNKNLRYRCWLMMAIILLAGCARHSDERNKALNKQVVENLAASIPSKVSARQAWAEDIVYALSVLQLPVTLGNGCAVAAIIEQESGFAVNPKIPRLPAIAWTEIKNRAAKIPIPFLLVQAALQLHSKSGQTYAQRLDNVSTEKQLSDLYDDLIASVPLGQRLFGRFNPVHTAGPMQVSVAFSERFRDKYPVKSSFTVRQQLFTRRGGVFFGTLHLLGNPAQYQSLLFTFADYNAGWFASRNAAFQAAVARISGNKLALDGDLIAFDKPQTGQTEQAVISLANKLHLTTKQIHRDLVSGTDKNFQQTATWKAVFKLASVQANSNLPSARLPEINLNSPKISRKLSTAWFAKRVYQRFQRCLTAKPNSAFRGDRL